MFAPLALTQALPYLPLVQGDIDYQVDRRDDPQLIEQTLQLPSTRVLLCRNGRVAVPFGQHNLLQLSNSRMRLAALPGSYAAARCVLRRKASSPCIWVATVAHTTSTRSPST